MTFLKLSISNLYETGCNHVEHGVRSGWALARQYSLTEYVSNITSLSNTFVDTSAARQPRTCSEVRRRVYMHMKALADLSESP